MNKASTPCPSWNPYQTFTWTRQQINAWIDTYGSWTFYDGLTWKIKADKIFGSRYEVKFVRTNP